MEKSRWEWLGKRIQFRHLLDKKMKVGTITRVEDNGMVVMEYQMFPWPGEPPGECITEVGHEVDMLRLLDGVVLDDEGVACPGSGEREVCL